MSVDSTTDLVVPVTPAGALEQQTEIADLFKRVVSEKKLAVSMRGNEHLRVEAWQLLGSMNGITAVVTSTDEIENGYKAVCEARRVSDGQVVGSGHAICTRDERMWAKNDAYALLSMAQTRATSKAIKSCLGHIAEIAGFKTTPAEEMTGVGGSDEATGTTGKPSVYMHISSKQINLIRVKCSKKGIEDAQLATMMHAASGTDKPAPAFEDYKQAEPWVRNALPLFHKAWMTRLLEAIDEAPDNRSETRKALARSKYQRDREMRQGD